MNYWVHLFPQLYMYYGDRRGEWADIVLDRR